MTERLSATADWTEPVADLAAHVLSDYEILRPGADERLSLHIVGVLEDELAALIRHGEIALARANDRVCPCWTCSPGETKDVLSTSP
jgi:hypothetical protein